MPAPAQTRAKCWLNTAEIQREYETEKDRTLPNTTTHIHTHNTSHKDINCVGKIYLGGGANRAPMPRNYKLSLLNSQGCQEPLWSQQSWTRLLRGTTGKADYSTATLTWQGHSISLTFSSFFFCINKRDLFGNELENTQQSGKGMCLGRAKTKHRRWAIHYNSGSMYLLFFFFLFYRSQPLPPWCITTTVFAAKSCTAESPSKSGIQHWTFP